MPVPVSLTESATHDPSAWVRTTNSPPLGIASRELVARLSRICSISPGSAITPRPGAQVSIVG
jgi:hypothetical protein